MKIALTYTNLKLILLMFQMNAYKCSKNKFFLSYNKNSYVMRKAEMNSHTSLFGFFTDNCPHDLECLNSCYQKLKVTVHVIHTER